MELEKPDPAAPAALVLSVAVTALGMIFGPVPILPVVPALAGVFWLALSDRRWIWRQFGRVTRLVVPLVPALAFSSLFVYNRVSTAGGPAVPGGFVTQFVLFVSGLWLVARIRSQQILEQRDRQTFLLAWEGRKPVRSRLVSLGGKLVASGCGVALVQLYTGELPSLGSVAPAVIGTAIGAGIGTTIATSADQNWTTYTAYEDGLLIDRSRFVPASEIRGFERTESTLVIETKSRLDTVLRTRRFGAHKIRLDDIDSTEVCRILDQYQTTASAGRQTGPNQTPA